MWGKARLSGGKWRWPGQKFPTLTSQYSLWRSWFFSAEMPKTRDFVHLTIPTSGVDVGFALLDVGRCWAFSASLRSAWYRTSWNERESRAFSHNLQTALCCRFPWVPDKPSRVLFDMVADENWIIYLIPLTNTGRRSSSTVVLYRKQTQGHSLRNLEDAIWPSNSRYNSDRYLILFIPRIRWRGVFNSWQRDTNFDRLQT